jgi:predicted nucleic acid-binding protein
MNESYVLDAWAFLAFLQKEEPAGSHVRQLIQEAQNQTIRLFASIINLGEVYYRIGKTRGQDFADETLEELRRLPITILSAGDEAVWTAAQMKISHAISYADAFAAATARQLGALLVTGDPELLKLEGELRMEKLSRQ